ncbi:MAG: CHC2 zinc finger domain-containing protein [Ruthenibacterium lactatiformans]
MIPRDYITELVQRSDIVDVVQSYVQLRHRGRTHTGLCPFHNEKTPSFVVYPETQSFYCFGCGAGGDVITFIKKINNVDYMKAVKFACRTRRCGSFRRRMTRPAACAAGSSPSTRTRRASIFSV